MECIRIQYVVTCMPNDAICMLRRCPLSEVPDCFEHERRGAVVGSIRELRHDVGCRTFAQPTRAENRGEAYAEAIWYSGTAEGWPYNGPVRGCL